MSDHEYAIILASRGENYHLAKKVSENGPVGTYKLSCRRRAHELPAKKKRVSNQGDKRSASMAFLELESSKCRVCMEIATRGSRG